MTQNKQLTLRDLHIGQTATITSVGGEGSLRQHFLDMGVLPGAEVTLVKYAPMLCKNKKAKKQLYQKAAFAYQNAGVLHRCIQFKIKAFFT